MKDFSATDWIKKRTPAGLKTAAKSALRRYDLKRAIRAIRQLPAGEVPDRKVLLMLTEGWGNPGYEAKLDYLVEVATKAAATPGPILECGSGLTTILTGLLAGRRGVELWSLEHTAEWRLRLMAVLSRHQISNTQVVLAPLREFDGFTWYDAPVELPDNFSLVICDGPPGDTPGGRYGLLPVAGNRLAKGAVILLDDVGRPSEQEVIERWRHETKLSVELHQNDEAGFATITIR